jgi:hypothetical protein
MPFSCKQELGFARHIPYARAYPTPNLTEIVLLPSVTLDKAVGRSMPCATAEQPLGAVRTGYGLNHKGKFIVGLCLVSMWLKQRLVPRWALQV